jgi:hypothetical protein
MKQRAPLSLLPLVFVVLSACGRNAVSVYPTAAAPGETVRLTVTGRVGTATPSYRVHIGGQPVPVARIHNGTALDVIVPALPPDSVSVEVWEARRPLGVSGLRILRPSTKRVLLSYEDGRTRVLAVTPSVKRPTGRAGPGRARFSFDVVNRSNAVVFTGSIPNPARELGESYIPDASGEVRARPFRSDGRAVFSVYIPASADSVWLDVYDTEAGVDLTNPVIQRRALRRLARVEIAP